MQILVMECQSLSQIIQKRYGIFGYIARTLQSTQIILRLFIFKKFKSPYKFTTRYSGEPKKNFNLIKFLVPIQLSDIRFCRISSLRALVFQIVCMKINSFFVYLRYSNVLLFFLIAQSFFFNWGLKSLYFTRF